MRRDAHQMNARSVVKASQQSAQSRKNAASSLVDRPEPQRRLTDIIGEVERQHERRCCHVTSESARALTQRSAGASLSRPSSRLYTFADMDRFLFTDLPLSSPSGESVGLLASRQVRRETPLRTASDERRHMRNNTNNRYSSPRHHDRAWLSMRNFELRSTS